MDLSYRGFVVYDHRALRHAPHFVFFVVVGSALVRLAELNLALCWDIVTLSGLLATTYAAGLALGDRLGPLARHVWVAVLVALWARLVLLTPAVLTEAYVWCALPLACVALRALGRRAAAVAVGAVSVVLIGQLTRSAGGFDAEKVLIPVAAVWGTVALYRAQQRAAAERLRLVEELRGTRDVLAREQRRAGVLEERERIARDLHDTLAQELSGSLMLLQAAERDWERRPDTARTRVRAVADGLDVSLTETRRMIRDLTPSAVAEEGLQGSLRLLCRRAEQNGTAPRVQFRATGAHRPELDDQAATALFRVAQGMLANVREHARANSLLVTLHHGTDRVDLDVCDDGVGLDLAHVDGPSPTGRGFGLRAARARLREYGGDLAVEGGPGRGTRIRATVPARVRSEALPATTRPAVVR
ncbi:sensor histidine kinase [Streptomyces griseorubiginosus]|uniref:sensor histidine kinase n=1 Tax=Streptomyces griseorubiginosus TaxID=67304 RepID=UPI002E800A87|nr:sensor histidine kinase [Streptomyces griseorubiginosus]WUB43406.1 sensor histidine kinase [Streptomyces griseorubiginosus]WUB51925.1 sensor histidine kinase [Streptomyces griseorubiginosus]